MLRPDEWLAEAGIHFDDVSLVERALTHRSYVNENPDALEDNERLEFLGDAALDFLSGAWLYHHFPEMDEGQLTRLRSALVRTEQLAGFAQELGLGQALLLGHGEHLSGGRERSGLLCGAFEAFMGAMFLDGGLETVRQFMEPRFQRAVESSLKDDSLFDSRSLLQIWAQSEVGATPKYRTVKSSGPDHERVFVVEVKAGPTLVATGEGGSKQEAAKNAASSALRQVGWPNLQIG
jgi:ribonuclease-3